MACGRMIFTKKSQIEKKCRFIFLYFITATKTLKGSRNIQGFILIRALLFFFSQLDVFVLKIQLTALKKYFTKSIVSSANFQSAPIEVVLLKKKKPEYALKSGKTCLLFYPDQLSRKNDKTNHLWKFECIFRKLDFDINKENCEKSLHKMLQKKNYLTKNGPSFKFKFG